MFFYQETSISFLTCSLRSESKPIKSRCITFAWEVEQLPTPAVHLADRHGIRGEPPAACPLLSFLDTGGNIKNAGQKVSIYKLIRQLTTSKERMSQGEYSVEKAVW